MLLINRNFCLWNGIHRKLTFVLSHFSCFQGFKTPWTLWTVACQAPLSMGFSRQEYWSGLPIPSPENLSDSDQIQVSYISCNGRQVLYHQCHLGSPANLEVNQISLIALYLLKLIKQRKRHEYCKTPYFQKEESQIMLILLNHCVYQNLMKFCK